MAGGGRKRAEETAEQPDPFPPLETNWIPRWRRLHRALPQTRRSLPERPAKINI